MELINFKLSRSLAGSLGGPGPFMAFAKLIWPCLGGFLGQVLFYGFFPNTQIRWDHMARSDFMRKITWEPMAWT